MFKIVKSDDIYDIDENEDVINMWTPLDFDASGDYQYVSDNGLYILISDFIFYAIAAPVIFLISKIMLGLKIEGRENIKKVQGGAITVSNHINIIDCAMIGLAHLPDRLYYTASDESFKMPGIRHLVRLLNTLPIQKSIQSKKKLLNTIDNLLKEGNKVQVYPEASLWPYHDKIRRFKNGAFEIAVRNNVPVIPMVFTYRPVTGFRKYIKKKPFITLKILDPIYPNQELNKKEQVEQLKNIVSDKMKENI